MCEEKLVLNNLCANKPNEIQMEEQQMNEKVVQNDLYEQQMNEKLMQTLLYTEEIRNNAQKKDDLYTDEIIITQHPIILS